MPSVFISRYLKAESIFKQTLEQNGFRVEGESLIDFSPIWIQDFPETDWIFFYSKRGVQYFFRQPVVKLKLNKYNPKFGAIGQATAYYLNQFNIKACFSGNGDPIQDADAFLKVASGDTVLFPSASNSRQSIQKNLKNKIKSVNLFVYRNKAKETVQMKQNDYLVFTSPLNVEAYFRKHFLMPNQRIVAIGETTASALRRFGLSEIAVAASPSEASLAQRVLNF